MSSSRGTTCSDSKGKLISFFHLLSYYELITEEATDETVELRNLNRGTSGDTETEETTLYRSSSKEKDDETNRPWQTLVSYVDEITVGGRRNSKGQYVDGIGNFPGFGRSKPPKVPPNCFPRRCYDQ